MGLKLLTLAMCSVNRKKVKVHSTGEKAKVIATYVNGNICYQLEFDNGDIRDISWSEDNQGYITSGEELDEIDETTDLIVV